MEEFRCVWVLVDISSNIDHPNDLPSPPAQNPIPVLGPSTSHSAALSRLRSSSPRSMLSLNSKTATRDICCWLDSSLSTDKSRVSPSSMVAEVSMIADFVVRVSEMLRSLLERSYLFRLVNK